MNTVKKYLAMLPGLVILLGNYQLARMVIPVLRSMPQTPAVQYATLVAFGEYAVLLLLGLLPFMFDLSEGWPLGLKDRLEQIWTKPGGRTEIIISILLAGHFFLMLGTLDNLPPGQGDYPASYELVLWVMLLAACIGPTIAGIIFLIQGLEHYTLKELCSRQL